jgi:hypothetical protein
VHIDWSENYYDHRQESSSHDEIIIDVGRFASHSIQRQRSSNKNTSTIGTAADREASLVAKYCHKPKVSSSSAVMDVDTVVIPVNSADSANKTSDYNENSSSDCDPVIYVSNHSFLSISTLGTLGFKSSAAKKTAVDPFTASKQQEGEHHTTNLSTLLDGNVERSAEKKPPLTHPPPARPIKRQTSTSPTERNQRLLSSSSSVKYLGEGRPVVTNDSQQEDLSWQDRKAFEHNLKALKHVPITQQSTMIN